MIRARYIEEEAGEFLEKLSDGTIANQKPDGNEILSSMKAANITEKGVIQWYETCYCDTPLQHERETVYDFYLFDLTTEPVEDYGEVKGTSFWNYLQSRNHELRG